eukprot:4117705-Karenia_brevis.AAC.1
MGKGQRAHGSHPDAVKGDGMAGPVQRWFLNARGSPGRCVEANPCSWDGKAKKHAGRGRVTDLMDTGRNAQAWVGDGAGVGPQCNNQAL